MWTCYSTFKHFFNRHILNGQPNLPSAPRAAFQSVLLQKPCRFPSLALRLVCSDQSGRCDHCGHGHGFLCNPTVHPLDHTPPLHEPHHLLHLLLFGLSLVWLKFYSFWSQPTPKSLATCLFDAGLATVPSGCSYHPGSA